MDIIIKKSNRKSISIRINDDLDTVISAPFYVSDDDIIKFYNSNKAWVKKALDSKRRYLSFYSRSEEEINELKMIANEYLPKRVEYYSKLMGVNPTGVKITSAKKRFGSCNGKNGICFSCYLMLFSSEAVDYVVVHELAHIKYHNHSSDFYNYVESILPDYKFRESLLEIK